MRTGSASKLPVEVTADHPLRLWQRRELPTELRRDALLRLSDVALNRAAAELSETGAAPRDPATAAAQADRWRMAAAGAVVGDPAALLAVGRGLLAERASGDAGDNGDAALTALRLALYGGSRPERLVAAAELLLALPVLVGDPGLSTVRRARAMVSGDIVHRMLRQSMPRNASPEAALASVLAAWCTVAADAVRRGFPRAEHDPTALGAAHAALSVAMQAVTERSEAALPKTPEPFRRVLPGRGRMSAAYDDDDAQPVIEPELGGASTAISSLIPFPGYDPDRLADKRSLVAQRYAVLGTALPLIQPPGRMQADAGLDQLSAEMPNFAEIVTRVADTLALARRLPGQQGLHLPPLLLAGPPGIGKTRFARRLAEVLSLPFAWMSVAGSCDSRELVGTARGWSGTHPAWAVEQLASLRVGNPILLLDEIDRGGDGGQNGSAVDAILPLLEAGTARRYIDPCLGGPIDLSRISWILTANDPAGLPAALRSRVTTVHVSPPGPGHAGVLVRSILRDIASEFAVADVMMLPIVPPAVLGALRSAYVRKPDIRRLQSGVRRALALAARLEEEAEADHDLQPH